MTLFVDKIIPNNLGGITNDFKKAEYILAVHKMSFEKILIESSGHSNIPSGMFSTGRFIVCFNIARDLSNVNFGFINYKVDLQNNFDAFADCLSPKAVMGFHKFQEKLRLKEEYELNGIELSDNDSDFVIAYGKYIEHQKSK